MEGSGPPENPIVGSAEVRDVSPGALACVPSGSEVLILEFIFKLKLQFISQYSYLKKHMISL